MNYIYAAILGFFIDLVVGDPYWFPHPVRFIGLVINKQQKLIRKVCKSSKTLRVGAVFLVLGTVGLTVGLTYLILWGLSLWGEKALFCGQVFFSWTVLSTTCLAKEAQQVRVALAKGLDQGRARVAWIVGRDTTELTQEEVIKATIETVAENTTDGIVSPLMYLLLGGPVLAMGFKAVSTLDSMVGYLDEKYRNIGWASARFDDVLNYIPARITGVLMVVGAYLSRLDGKAAWRILGRDHANHKSPNCGWAEAAAAGALGLQLGGTHYYFGKKVYKPTIGDSRKAATQSDITRMNGLMYLTACLALLLLSGISFIMHSWL